MVLFLSILRDAVLLGQHLTLHGRKKNMFERHTAGAIELDVRSERA